MCPVSQVLEILFEVLGTSEVELDIDALADLLVRKDMAYSQDQVCWGSCKGSQPMVSGSV